MAKFSYRAKNFDGRELFGERDAENERELTRVLREEGYTLVDIGPSQGKKFDWSLVGFKKFSSLLVLFKRVSIAEKMLFSKNLAVMIRAGLSLSRALDALSRETRNSFFRTVLESISADIKKGSNLHESFSKYPNVFPPLFIAMVEAGEKSGKLDMTFETLSNQMRQDHDLITRVRGALVYPALIIAAMIGIGILMLIYVVPTLLSTFEELNVELPSSTRIIVGISGFLLNHGFLVFLLFLIFLWLLFLLSKHRRVRIILSLFFVYTPLIAPLNQKFNTARTARTLSSLLASGVQILESLDVVSRVVQNHYYQLAILEAKSDIQKGKTISSVFRRYQHLFSPLLVEMLAVGEETGKMAAMLEEVASFYESEVASITRDMSSIIEPVLMIIIGIVVGLFAIAMISPLYSVLGNI